jgi:cation transport protein ChaC
MTQDLWVFAYGSLIWDPGFAPVERLPATVTGWHRSFCMTSVHYRGTPQAPGLVLALDAAQAAQCRGLALRVAPGQTDTVRAYLRDRELVSSAYEERLLPAALADGRQVSALAYVINRDHGQYCRHDADTQAAIIARAHGLRGPNRDYLFQTASHLADLGIPDPELSDLVARVRNLTGADPA